MKSGFIKISQTLFLATTLFVCTSALSEEIFIDGLTDVPEVVEEVGEVDMYAPEVYVDPGETGIQTSTAHNVEYYYDIDSTFPDAVFRRYVKQNYDWDGDGYLSDEECEAVTCIDVENMGIKSLEGIYVFENLQKLWCRDNKIEGLDVSSNSSLETLICDSNRLTALFLPDDGVLDNLSCCDNQLTWLDLSQSSFLEYLSIYHNDINEIDISACDSLIGLMDEKPEELHDVDLDCYYISWDGGGNPITKVLQIDKDTYIYASGETLYAPLKLVVEIDSKHFPADDFRDYVLDNCDTNRDGWLNVEEIAAVTAIELRSFEDIEQGKNEMNCPNLKGIEYFSDLRYLLCSDCGVKNLNLKKNRNLETLNCSDNSLKGLDLSQNNKLESIDCASNKLKKLDLRNNNKLTYIYCNYNSITELDVKKAKKLEYLSCECNNMKKLHLGKNKKLDTLYANGNKLKKIDIKNCPKLRQRLKLNKRIIFGSLQWYDDVAYIVIDPTTKLTAGSKILYAGK